MFAFVLTARRYRACLNVMQSIIEIYAFALAIYFRLDIQRRRLIYRLVPIEATGGRTPFVVDRSFEDDGSRSWRKVWVFSLSGTAGAKCGSDRLQSKQTFVSVAIG